MYMCIFTIIIILMTITITITITIIINITIITTIQDEADAMCTKIAIMSKGQIRAIGSRHHLKAQLGQCYEINMKLHFTGTI